MGGGGWEGKNVGWDGGEGMGWMGVRGYDTIRKVGKVVVGSFQEGSFLGRGEKSGCS